MANKIADKDSELVHRVRDGDLAAFRTLVDLYKDKSLSLAVSIVKDEHLAEDVLQEVFMKVFKSIKRFNFKSKFSTWLYRIVVNTCYNEVRKKKHNVPIEEVGDFQTEKNSNTHPQPLTAEDQKKYIIKAMKQLKADEALALRLFYLCEMSLKEITSISGYSASKVRVDLHRGRNNLRQQLQRLLGEEIDTLL